MSVTMPNGWAMDDSSVAFGGSVKFTHDLPQGIPGNELRLLVMDNYMNYGEKEYAEDFMAGQKGMYADDYEFTALSEITIGSDKAYEYTRTKKSGSGMMERQTIIVKGEFAYHVIATTQQEKWDVVEKDFNSMRDSLTLK